MNAENTLAFHQYKFYIDKNINLHKIQLAFLLFCVSKLLPMLRDLIYK